MKPNGVTSRHQSLLRCFTHLPHQILRLNELDNATEFVLHSLCDEGCLNLSKAAYFVDNPDFDCLKGVAGFNKEEGIFTCDTVLESGQPFSDHVNKCAYNQKVRGISLQSPKRNGDSPQKAMETLAEMLGMTQPSCHSWNIKHDNFGLLIFEREDAADRDLHEEFLQGLSILGFCPVS